MKITGIKVRQVEVPLVEPFRISLGVITHSRSVIVQWKRMKVWLVTEKGRRRF